MLRTFYIDMINRPMHIYEYVQSHIIILQQHVSATPVTINRVPYKKNIIKIQLVVKKVWQNTRYYIRSFLALLMAVKYQITLSIQYSKIRHCSWWLSDVCSLFTVGQDSSVGIATPYGLDGPGIESRWWRDFPHPSRPSLRPTQPPVQWVLGLSLR